MIEEAGIGGHVGSWCASDGFLIDDNETTDTVNAGGDFSAGCEDSLFKTGLIFFFRFDWLTELYCD